MRLIPHIECPDKEVIQEKTTGGTMSIPTGIKETGMKATAILVWKMENQKASVCRRQTAGA